MFGIHDLTLFIISGLLLNLMPGPDSLLIMTRSATQGWRAGSAAALGIGAGTMIHIFAAALGLSALLSTSAAAFTAVKWVGAAYIVYVGIGMLRAKLRAAEDAAGRGAGRRTAAGVSPHLLPGLSDQRAESESGAVLPGVRAAVYSCRLHQQAAGLHRPGLHLQLQRHVVV
jgi:threonine/homoserine/homoserine lactone efflux protein